MKTIANHSSFWVNNFSFVNFFDGPEKFEAEPVAPRVAKPGALFGLFYSKIVRSTLEDLCGDEAPNFNHDQWQDFLTDDETMNTSTALAPHDEQGVMARVVSREAPVFAFIDESECEDEILLPLPAMKYSTAHVVSREVPPFVFIDEREDAEI